MRNGKGELTQEALQSDGPCVALLRSRELGSLPDKIGGLENQ